jgi:hypothetical protein
MNRLLGFVSIAFGWTWTLWGIASVSHPDRPWRNALVALGGAGPALAASIVSTESLGDLWTTHWHLDQLSPSIVARVTLIPLIACWIAGTFTWGFRMAPLKQAVDPYPAGLSPISLFVVSFAASPFLVLEELGWRVFLWPALQAAPFNMAPLFAGAVVGVFWALWHAPLFWPGPVPSRPAHLLAAETPALVPRRLVAYIAALAIASTLLVAVGAAQSLTTALLFHASFNSAFVLWKPSRLQNVMEQAAVCLSIALIVAF